MTGKVIALSGGVGGAKLALGLSKILAPDELTIIANTGDDFEHLGLHISPDIDTLIYTLASLANPAQGWGLKDESWHFMEALKAADGETWFQLGDKDLVTHVLRTKAMREGKTLTEITYDLCLRYGVSHKILPMSDDPVRTRVITAEGPLDFQHYFVRERCAPKTTGFEFTGIKEAELNPAIEQALTDTDLSAIIICPSNPFVSVDPILMTGNMRALIKASGAPVIAISPIVGGQALKGPAAKMMQELGLPTNVSGIADHYEGLIDGLIIDETDRASLQALQARPFKVLVTNTIMNSLEDRIALAAATLSFAKSVQSSV
ncbi:MAG: 2-phospho-L-lactate transferase [Alphaproteobacteria bacterium]|nr:MAG: 2-phospho-L-lactate transferase [Alphaproteobacteria bacterium]